MKNKNAAPLRWLLILAAGLRTGKRFPLSIGDYGEPPIQKTKGQSNSLPHETWDPSANWVPERPPLRRSELEKRSCA